ncbi:unnamed protein product [Danaus chrysippus]|uniref:(African queen) hypothetical protein n=1 Tax=Danaus chrysippus TaxID=151541 RepID=A0A8J2QLE7_9NEOP|nr:unnamed protein product [Danaus chrysippus]
MDKTILVIPLTIFIIATIYCDIIESSNEDCISKFTNGTCVNVSDCPYALTLIYKRDVDKLSNLTCGFNKNQPMVCCPQQDLPILYDTKEEPATNRPKPMNLKPVATTTFSPHIETKNDSSNVLPNKTICGKVNNKGVTDRIVGGSVVEIDEHPWLARVQHKLGDDIIFGCAAALISNIYLLTAAHCVQNPKLIPYNGKINPNNDIALIRLREPVTFTEEESVLKRKVELNAVPIEICRNYLDVAPEAEPNIICVGGKKGKDTCSGDSGGPLVKIESENYEENWYMFGITSLGFRECGLEGIPGIYTRVSSYMDWILDNVKE